MWYWKILYSTRTNKFNLHIYNHNKSTPEKIKRHNCILYDNKLSLITRYAKLNNFNLDPSLQN